jgi:hypothetical protein
MIRVIRRTKGSSRFPLIIHRSSFPLAFTIPNSQFTIDMFPFSAILRRRINVSEKCTMLDEIEAGNRERPQCSRYS